STALFCQELSREAHMTIQATFRVWLSCCAAVLCLLMTGCCAAADAREHPLNVVATTSMLGDAARQVGGDRVRVTALMGVGVDPHTYRQTRSDIIRMVRADVVIWHGLHLEAQLESLLHDLARRKPVVAVAETIPKD